MRAGWLAVALVLAGAVPWSAAIPRETLSAEEAAALELRLATEPDDLGARTRLLEHYFLLARSSDDVRRKREAHILWVIRHRPEASVAGTPYAMLYAPDGSAFQQASELWVRTVEDHPLDPRVLWNAARFHTLSDRDRARSLLERGEALEPSNPRWAKQLGHLHSLGAHSLEGPERTAAARASLGAFRRALAASAESDSGILEEAARAAVDAGELADARAYATQLLQDLPGKDDWNYGNAVHHGHLVLGRVALRNGDLELARRELLAAGATPGSPQLNSFGPNMTLALELLQKGERDVVLQYFDLCGRFWEMGHQSLLGWTAVVKEGGIPDFGANLAY
jgi:hypothetical protein